MSQYKELQKRINGALVALSKAAGAKNVAAPDGATSQPASNASPSVGGVTQKDIDKLVNENAVFTNRNRVLQRKLEDQEAAFKSLSRSLAQLDDKQKTLQAQLSEVAALQAKGAADGADVQAAVNSMIEVENARLKAFKDEAAVVLAALNTALAEPEESPTQGSEA